MNIDIHISEILSAISRIKPDRLPKFMRQLGIQKIKI